MESARYLVGFGVQSCDLRPEREWFQPLLSEQIGRIKEKAANETFVIDAMMSAMVSFDGVFRPNNPLRNMLPR